MGWWRNAAHPFGDAVYSPTANFDVTLTAPENWILISSGVSVESTLDADKTRTHHYIAPLMRDFALMASPDYQTLTGEQDGITVDIHYLPGGRTAGEVALEYAQNALRLFNQMFGPYPYIELDFAVTYTEAGGIEYPGLIVVQADSWNAREMFLEVVVVHETAHQWFYSIIGNDQTRYPWLDEALAQYATTLYYGELYGPDSQAGILDFYEQSWQRYVTDWGADEPVGLSPSAYNNPDAYFAFVYAKGPVFFAELADMVGQEAVLDALGFYFHTNRYGIATPAALQYSLENSLQQDLDALFLEWVGATD